MLWRSKDNKTVIEISDMSDEYLNNAIKYTKKLYEQYRSYNFINNLNVLMIEYNKRKLKKIIETTKRACPFCNKCIMKMVEFAPDIEDATYNHSHALVCSNCGAQGTLYKGYLIDHKLEDK